MQFIDNYNFVLYDRPRRTRRFAARERFPEIYWRFCHIWGSIDHARGCMTPRLGIDPSQNNPDFLKKVVYRPLFGVITQRLGIYHNNYLKKWSIDP